MSYDLLTLINPAILFKNFWGSIGGESKPEPRFIKLSVRLPKFIRDSLVYFG